MYRLIYIVIFISFQFGANSQAAYYVSEIGDNLNNGSFEAPWSSIQFGVDHIGMGDSLFIRGGSYPEHVSITQSGNKINSLFISSFKGEKVEITGGMGVEDALILLEEVNYVTLNGLELTNQGQDLLSSGIQISSCNNIEIRNCKIYNNNFGILLDNSELSTESSFFTVKNNFIYRNQGPGLLIGPVEPNENSGLITEVLIQQNSFFNNDRQLSARGEIQLGYCHLSEINNNIFYTGEQSIAYSVFEYFYTMNFDFNAYYTVLNEDKMSFSWNGQIYEGFESFRTLSNKEENGLFSNPLFLSTSEEQSDLHLTPNSPMIDRGDPFINKLAGETDIDGQDRINILPEIGADEYYLSLIICSLGSFNAEVVNDQVEMNWSGTCFSENGGKYLVQRSRDSEEWEIIGEVLSKIEELNTEVFYKFSDRNPLDGFSYYRVQFIDDNGSFNNSNPDAVEFTSSGILIYPNPAKEHVNVLFGDDHFQAEKRVKIYNASAQLLDELILQNRKLDISNYPLGLLLIEIYNVDYSTKAIHLIIHIK